MTGEPDRLTLLQRLDLVLAERLSRRTTTQAWPEDWRPPWQKPDSIADATWIAKVLRLRDFEIDVAAVEAVLGGGEGGLAPGSQELCLARGLALVLGAMRDRAAAGEPIDGQFLWNLFRTMTDGVRRFRNNTVRRDVPWDAVAQVTYPEPSEVPGLLQGFGPDNCYGEDPDSFAALHPVRQSVRVLWRFARLAPFPDLNLVMATIAMNAYLMTCGYPMITPESGDRDILTNLVAGDAPQRVIRFEARLAKSVEV